MYLQIYMSYANLGRQIFSVSPLYLSIIFSCLPLLSLHFLLLPAILPHHFSVLSLNLVVKFIETMLQVWEKEVKQTVFTMPKNWNAKGKSSFQFRKFSSLVFHIKKVLELKQTKTIFRNIKVLDEICFTGKRF